MAVDFAALIARMDEQRTQAVDLPDGKTVFLLRPLETDFGRFVGGVEIAHLCEYVCGWRGFTEADLLGAAVGSSDPLPFDSDLWARVLRDRSEYVEPLVQAFVNCITAHLKAREDAKKN